MKTFAFIIPPNVELLDLAGPVQVSTEAKFYGFEADIQFYKLEDLTVSTAGLGFGDLALFNSASLKEGDYVFVPGMNFDYVNSLSFRAQKEFFDWLKACSQKKITVCSICNGAFALGHAGLLKDTQCTTHWRRVKALQEQFPEAKVVSDVLYIKSNNVY